MKQLHLFRFGEAHPEGGHLGSADTETELRQLASDFATQYREDGDLGDELGHPLFWQSLSPTLTGAYFPTTSEWLYVSGTILIRAPEWQHTTRTLQKPTEDPRVPWLDPHLLQSRGAQARSFGDGTLELRLTITGTDLNIRLLCLAHKELISGHLVTSDDVNVTPLPREVISALLDDLHGPVLTTQV